MLYYSILTSQGVDICLHGFQVRSPVVWKACTRHRVVIPVRALGWSSRPFRPFFVSPFGRFAVSPFYRLDIALVLFGFLLPFCRFSQRSFEDLCSVLSAAPRSGKQSFRSGLLAETANRKVGNRTERTKEHIELAKESLAWLSRPFKPFSVRHFAVSPILVLRSFFCVSHLPLCRLSQHTVQASLFSVSCAALRFRGST